jgi:hypothetical protein
MQLFTLYLKNLSFPLHLLTLYLSFKKLMFSKVYVTCVLKLIYRDQRIFRMRWTKQNIQYRRTIFKIC